MSQSGDPEVPVSDGPAEAWVPGVIGTIPQDWLDFLGVEAHMVDEETKPVLEILRDALRAVHSKRLRYNDQDSVPDADHILNWMSCPPRSIKAIILLMEPLPKENNYKSTGYALGVQHRGENRPKDIMGVPTLKNFFYILSDLIGNREWDMSKYNEGFDPTALSETGILFLNTLLTKPSKRTTESDFDEWEDFSEALLGAIGKNKGVEKIAVIQFYNNARTQDFLENKADMFSVYRPSFMDQGAGGHRHLGYFDEENIKTFVEGLRNQADFFDKMTEIANEVIYGNRCVIPPSTEH